MAQDVLVTMGGADMLFERLSEDTLAAYERCYFEEVCKIPTGRRSTFSTPLPQIEGLHFACVQDTVERLIETEHGRLSTFQWRNFVFAPIDRNVSEKDVYERVFDELRRALPSIFIRSYVYLVFIEVYGAGALTLPGVDSAPRARDFQTYYWNTNYDIENIAPSKLALIGNPQKDARGAKKGGSPRRAERVFIVSDPRAELQRIQDANSDVIDAVKAFTGNLGLVKQTSDMLDDVEAALRKPGARVLLEGPARSGKTIIAMSLLASDPSAKMLLMNWYFYDALRDAFKIWARQDEEDIARLFEPSQKLKREIAVHEEDLGLLRANERDPRVIDALIQMWRNPPKPNELPGWVKRPTADGGEEWLLTRCQGMRPGDLVYAWQKSKRVVQLHLIGEVLGEGLARPGLLFESSNMYNNLPVGNGPNDELDAPISFERIPERLERLRDFVAGKDIAAVIARKLKTISDALEASEQRFFHHDRNYPDGLWIERGRKLIPDYGTLVCDEAQRLGKYGDLDECEWVRHRPGRTFLCGDDYQRLNKRGDRGISPILEGVSFDEYHLPDSVGIPPEIGLLVKAMLGEAETPMATGSFTIKLLYRDDLGLVKEFGADPHGKKHYAIPMNTGFYKNDYMPCIMRSRERTDRCTDECDAIPHGLCRHRYILPLSPLSDREWMPKRKDLSRHYKFFCAEAIMPEYALSAYELISREVESVYLKIPWQITPETISASMDGDSTSSWIKRHLYVLMTRATANLVINIEDRRLYELFKKKCEEAGISC
jgi:hypothetical protein